MFWVLGGALEAFSTQTCMILWMKASGLFTRVQNNNYPVGITAIGMSSCTKQLHPGRLSRIVLTDSPLGVVLTLLTSVAIDATGKHAPYGFAACGVQIITCIVLLCWDVVGTGAKMFAFCKFLL